jgi:CRP-like cAMP-binding protein
VQSAAAKHTSAKQRRPSIDDGKPDWPDAADMNTFYPHPALDTEALTQLVGELRTIMNVPRSEATQAVRGYFKDHGGTSSASSPTSNPTPATASGMARDAKGPTEPQRALPSKQNLIDFPPELWDHIQNCAGAILAAFLIPQMRRRHRRQQRALRHQQRARTAAPFTADALQRVPIYRSWPPEIVAKLASQARFVSFSKGEVIVYAQEPSHYTIMLVQGTVAACPPRVPAASVALVATKPTAASATATGSPLAAHSRSAPAALPPLATAPGPLSAPSGGGGLVAPYSAIERGVTYRTAPCVLGELNVVVDEPWPKALVAATACDAYIVTREAVTALMAALPPQVVQSTHKNIMERRNAEFAQLRPFDANDARECGLFKGVSEEFAADIASRVEPHVFKTKDVLTRENQPADAVYFIRRGRVKLSRRLQNEDVVIQTPSAPLLAGDTAVVGNSLTFDTTVVAVTDIDSYMLSRASFQAAVKKFPADLEKMASALAQHRRDDLRRNLLRHRDLVEKIPLLKDLPLTPYDIRDFLLLLQPKTYRPLTSVCSQSVFADKLIVVMKGHLRMTEGETVEKHGVLGWTCTVPHRWGRGCMTAMEPCEVLELSGEQYITFLQDRGYLSRVKEETLRLLFPKAHRADEVREVTERLPPHVPIHPVSKSTRINLNEMKFCSVHMAELKRERTKEEQAKHERALQTPPPFRALSGTLWAPKGQQSRGFVVTNK